MGKRRQNQRKAIGERESILGVAKAMGIYVDDLFLREKRARVHWIPPLVRKRIVRNRRTRPKVCEICFKRSKPSPCSPSCRKLAHLIGVLLSHNPRYAPKSVRVFLLQRSKYRCQYCGKRVTWGTANVEHIKPWPKGKTKLGNLTIACGLCNKNKLRQKLSPEIMKAVKRGLMVV